MIIPSLYNDYTLVGIMIIPSLYNDYTLTISI